MSLDNYTHLTQQQKQRHRREELYYFYTHTLYVEAVAEIRLNALPQLSSRICAINLDF